MAPAEEHFLKRVLFKTLATRPLDAFHGFCIPLPAEGLPISGVDLSGQGSGLTKRRSLSCYYGFVPAAERPDSAGTETPSESYPSVDSTAPLHSLVCFVAEQFDCEDLELYVFLSSSWVVV